jgi:hypothetical protein
MVLFLVNGKVVTEPGFGIDPSKDKVTLNQEKLPERNRTAL